MNGFEGNMVMVIARPRSYRTCSHRSTTVMWGRRKGDSGREIPGRWCRKEGRGEIQTKSEINYTTEQQQRFGFENGKERQRSGIASAVVNSWIQGLVVVMWH